MIVSAILVIVINALGVGLVTVALRDIFHQLFNPGGSGHLSDVLMHAVWRVFQRASTRRPGALGLAGPIALVVIILSWATLMTVGWALVYWPYMPESFLYSTGLSPSANAGFIDALYFSLLTLATLWLRRHNPHRRGVPCAVSLAGPDRLRTPDRQRDVGTLDLPRPLPAPDSGAGDSPPLHGGVKG